MPHLTLRASLCLFAYGKHMETQPRIQTSNFEDFHSQHSELPNLHKQFVEITLSTFKSFNSHLHFPLFFHFHAEPAISCLQLLDAFPIEFAHVSLPQTKRASWGAAPSSEVHVTEICLRKHYSGSLQVSLICSIRRISRHSPRKPILAHRCHRLSCLRQLACVGNKIARDTLVIRGHSSAFGHP